MSGCNVCGCVISTRNMSGRCRGCNGRAALKTRSPGTIKALDWLPDEWCADYYRWTREMKIPAAEAKRMILEHIQIRGHA